MATRRFEKQAEAISFIAPVLGNYYPSGGAQFIPSRVPIFNDNVFPFNYRGRRNEVVLWRTLIILTRHICRVWKPTLVPDGKMNFSEIMEPPLGAPSREYVCPPLRILTDFTSQVPSSYWRRVRTELSNYAAIIRLRFYISKLRHSGGEAIEKRGAREREKEGERERHGDNGVLGGTMAGPRIVGARFSAINNSVEEPGW